MPPTTKVVPRTARREASLRRILDAAWELSRERGLTGWTLRDLGTAVGMRAPSLYVYFDSKNALYDALFADGYRRLLDRVAEVHRPDDPRETLRLAAHLYVDFCVQDPARTQLLFLRTIPGFEPSPESYALAQQVLDRLAEALAAAGAPDPADLDLWTAVLTGLATQQTSNDPGGDRWSRLVDTAVDRLLPATGGRGASEASVSRPPG
jgi:AcrR family transcriptional regulator